MRRVLTFLTAIALLLVSLAVGTFTADLPFWRRALQLPLPEGGVYLPVAVIGLVGARPLDVVSADAAALDALTLEDAAERARTAGSRALLVMHRGRLQFERYFTAADVSVLMPAALVARPVLAMAVGTALADGRIASLDIPVARYLPEWNGEARGRITLRQLLEETSGLETGGDTRRLMYRAPWDDPTRLPAFATAKGVRMLLGNDFVSTALGFSLKHEPGGFYNVSPANSQLAAVILERATGTPYETYLDERLWRSVGAGPAELPLDRRTGMPAAHCCWRAAARDMLRIVNLLATDGVHEAKQVLPAGWVSEMMRPSRVSAESGLQIARVRIGDSDALEATDDNGSAFWVIPDRQLTILNIAAPGGGSAQELPALLLKALRAPK
jgi:CubicO group peptidase (beta-lactamase class C family)